MSRFSDFLRRAKNTSCNVVVVAAGASTRMGEDKLFMDLAGKPVLARTLTALNACNCVDEIVGRGEDTLLVAHNGSLSLVLAHLGIAGEKELLHPGWFFRQGCYTALDVTGGKGTLLGFNL